MKRIKWVVLSLIAVVVLVVAVVILRIDSIVRRAVEAQSTASLGLQTQLGAARVSLLGGSVALRQFEVASPEGFRSPRMFTLGGITVGVSVANLRAQPMSIDQVAIDSPRFVIEQLDGKFNFQTLADLKSNQPSGGDPLKLIISDLTVNNAQVVVQPGIGGLQKELVLPIPSFHVRNIGTGEGSQNGAAVKEVVLLVLRDLAQHALASGKLPAEVEKLLAVNVEQFRQQVEAEVGRRVEKAAQQVTDKLPGDVGKKVDQAIEKGIGDLLNTGKEPKKPGE